MFDDYQDDFDFEDHYGLDTPEKKTESKPVAAPPKPDDHGDLELSQPAKKPDNLSGIGLRKSIESKISEGIDLVESPRKDVLEASLKEQSISDLIQTPKLSSRDPKKL